MSEEWTATIVAGHQHADQGPKRGTGAIKMLKIKVECAGINRQEAEDERSSRERSSEPLGPEFCTAICRSGEIFAGDRMELPQSPAVMLAIWREAPRSAR